jgi:hypothetical protein
LLLDPVSYQVTGLRSVSAGAGDAVAKKAAVAKGGRSTVPPKGTVLDSLAYITVREVAKPGAR